MSTTVLQHPKIVSQEEWLAARRRLLVKEKKLTRERDALAAARRRLPWVKVEKNYVFDSPTGKTTLAELFDGRSQLMIYHFMFGPEWPEGCPGCSTVGDHLDGSVSHLANRDVTLIAASRALLAEIEGFKKRMGWRFRWVSSFGSDFNRDFHVSFAKEEIENGNVVYNYQVKRWRNEEMPGLSVFHGMKRARCFTRTRPTRADSSRSWASTTGWTSRQRAAAKKA